jgi:hypothetical protein
MDTALDYAPLGTVGACEIPLQRFVPNGEIVVPVEAALNLAPQKGKRRAP